MHQPEGGDGVFWLDNSFPDGDCDLTIFSVYHIAIWPVIYSLIVDDNVNW